MIRCSICRLSDEKRSAINASLQAGVSLDELAAQTGIHRSSLGRHGRNCLRSPVPVEQSTPISTPPKAAVEVRLPKTVASMPPKPVAPAHAVQTPDPAAPLDMEARRRQALERAEQLWSELEECLRLAREPVVIVKPDGSTLEVPVDLRTRSSVIRAGKDVIDLDARLNGLYDNPAAAPFGSVVFQSVIMMPKITDLEPPQRPDPKVVDALPEPARSLSEGGTPDRGITNPDTGQGNHEDHTT
jgi:hypothetical protein